MSTGIAPESWSPGDDVLALIQQTQDSIRHADNKAGVVVAACTILLSGMVARVDALGGGWLPGQAGFRAVNLFVVLAGLALLVSYALTLVTLLARFSRPGANSRFAWPWVAGQPVDGLLALTPDTVRAEAWTQAHALAVIARTKFSVLNRAMLTLALGGACYIPYELFH